MNYNKRSLLTTRTDSYYANVIFTRMFIYFMNVWFTYFPAIWLLKLNVIAIIATIMSAIANEITK